VTGPRGYAVVDTETTGLFTGFRHRIAEVAVIHVDPDGTVTDEWSTLLNPDRDLGPQAIHGIRAADVRRAPRFEEMAGDLAPARTDSKSMSSWRARRARLVVIDASGSWPSGSKSRISS
jgi:hypothetical protein